MRVFPSSAHLASWAGQCPANHQSAGKRRSGKPRQGSKWLQTTLNESAKAASRSKGTYLSAQYQLLRGRRGPGKATGALRHSILIAAYHILDQNVPYHELGADYFDQRHSLEHQTARSPTPTTRIHSHARTARCLTKPAHNNQPTKKLPQAAIFTLTRRLKVCERGRIHETSLGALPRR